MKKIFKFLFAIILSLIVIDNVKADDDLKKCQDQYNSSGIVDCFRGKSSRGDGIFLKASSDAQTAYTNDTQVAFRIAFFDSSTKNQIGKTYDYYPTGYWASNGLYVYYKHPKFYYSKNNFSFTYYSGSNSLGSAEICDSATCLPSKFPKNYSEQTSEDFRKLFTASSGKKDTPNDFLKKLMTNAGSSGSYNSLLTLYQNGKLWVSIEPIFEVMIKLFVPGDENMLQDACFASCPTGPKLEKQKCEMTCGNRNFFSKIKFQNTYHFKGTGTEMALILNYLNNNYETYGLFKEVYFGNGKEGLGFIRCTTLKSGGDCMTYKNFSKVMYLDDNEIPNSFVKKHERSWENLARGDSQWGLNTYNVSLGGTTPPPVVNPPTPSTPPSTVTLEYSYTCEANLNICDGVDHSFESLSNSSVGKAECVLHNTRYQNGSDNVWCYETTNTNLSSITNNLTHVIAGRFVPITGTPTSSISGTCYMPTKYGDIKDLQDNVRDKYSNSNIGKVSLKFFNNNASYTPGTATVSLKGSSTSTTEYGEKYAYVEFEVDYSYSTGTINKYVNKLNASGYTDKKGLSQYNTNYYNTNFKTPVLQAEGTYTDKLSVGLNTISSKLSSLISADSSVSYKVSGINVTDSDYCPGTCSVKISSKNNSNYDDALDKFKKNYGDKFKDFTSTPGEDKESATDCNIRCINEKEKSKPYCQNNCPKTYSYTTFTFTTDTRKQCESTSTSTNANATFTADNKNGCDVTLNFKNTKTTSGGPSLNCTLPVTVENELTTCDKNSPTYNSSTGLCDRQPFDKIVFRPIDLSNPFPGYSGTGRVSGSNWTSYYISEYITNRQDVYTHEPLYTVILTPTEIKEIREYNKSNNYDDFKLDCKDDNSRACYSSFIRNYLDENKSKCYNKLNQDKTTFESCTDYDSSTPAPTPTPTPTPTQPPRS